MHLITNKSFFFLLYKKRGKSSTFELNKLKHFLKIKKAGHCGTLDPMAEGLLVVAFNKATKLISYVTNDRKIYSGEMELGKISPSYDTETEIEIKDENIDAKKIDLNSLKSKFFGKITQTPPIYSAVKINGKRAYDLARKGEKPTLKQREVEIFSLDLSIKDEKTLFFKVECSKGTYIRSLVNDIGEFLGCGAIMTKLVRENVGEFLVERAVTLDFLKQNFEKSFKSFVSIDEFLKKFPKKELSKSQFEYLRNGNELKNCKIDFEEGLNYLKFDNKPAFLIEKTDEKLIYKAYLRDEE